MSKYFKLFSCCIPVKGASISIICDLQRNEIFYIPNELYEILLNNVIDVEKLVASFSIEEQDTIREYFDFFIDKEYGFYTDTPGSFPEINKEYIIPERINNVIVDVSNQSNHNFDRILFSLNILGCKFLELRFFSHILLSDVIDQYLSKISGSRLRSVTLFMRYCEDLTKENIYDAIISKYTFISKVIIHSAPYKKNEKSLKYGMLYYLTTEIISEKQCGNISKGYFSVNYPTFLESLNYNSCLYKKLAVDSSGLIKNCPSCESSFGDHKKDDIVEIVASSEFQKVWSITKDNIEVCKDCQFRYICTDCRAYIQNKDNIYSKPLKCSYNPYLDRWED